MILYIIFGIFYLLAVILFITSLAIAIADSEIIYRQYLPPPPIPRKIKPHLNIYQITNDTINKMEEYDNGE